MTHGGQSLDLAIGIRQAYGTRFLVAMMILLLINLAAHQANDMAKRRTPELIPIRLAIHTVLSGQ